MTASSRRKPNGRFAPEGEGMGVQFTFPFGEGGPLAVDEVLTENSIQYLSVGKGNLCAQGVSAKKEPEACLGFF